MLRRALARFPGLAQAIEVKRFGRSTIAYEFVAVVAFRDGPSILSRWDNEAHWPAVETFPHHQHLQDGTVGPSLIRSLEAVIEHIARTLGFTQDL
jgi:hypothetical protein